MGSSSDSKSHHMTVRMEAEQVEMIDTLGEQWGITKDDGSVNRSKTLRLITDLLNGILTGRFWAIVDEDKLADEWGSVGEVLAMISEVDGNYADEIRQARLKDVLRPETELIGAGRIEIEGIEGETNATE